MRKQLGRLAVIVGIAAIACAAALLLGRFTGKADDFFYDSFYRLRPPTDMRNSDVVLVAVDDPGLIAFNKPWPLPRTVWGDICTYLDHAGAKVIAFDIVFPNPSYYGDDKDFAAAMSKIKPPSSTVPPPRTTAVGTTSPHPSKIPPTVPSTSALTSSTAPTRPNSTANPASPKSPP